MKPKISVVVVVLTGGISLERCLHALSNQKDVDGIEIIVPEDEPIDSSGWRQKFPSVKFIHLDGRQTYAGLRSAGFQNATGEIVALTEDQCVPASDWCASIIQSHIAQHAAVGGAVEKGLDAGEDTNLNWAIYFCDYSRYANPLPEGPVQHLTDCNVSYKRKSLEPIRNIWQPEFHENVVHNALIGKGERLWFSPKVIVTQQRSLRVREAITERYVFGRLFASTRIAGEPFLKRAVHSISVLLLPLLLTGRIAKNVFSRKRYRVEFVRCLPWIFLLNCVWSVGELAGYAGAKRNSSPIPDRASA